MELGIQQLFKIGLTQLNEFAVATRPQIHSTLLVFRARCVSSTRVPLEVLLPCQRREQRVSV